MCLWMEPQLYRALKARRLLATMNLKCTSLIAPFVRQVEQVGRG